MAFGWAGHMNIITNPTFTPNPPISRTNVMTIREEVTQTGHDVKKSRQGAVSTSTWHVLLHPAACHRKYELRVRPKLNGDIAVKQYQEVTCTTSRHRHEITNVKM